MKKLNPDYVDIIMSLANGSSYFRHLSMAITRMDIGESHVEISLNAMQKQAFGFIHNGVIASLVKTACFFSLFSEIDATSMITTVDLNVNYLKPIQEGRLIAQGRKINLNRIRGLSETKVLKDGDVVAHGTCSVIVNSDTVISDRFQLPPKFL